MGEKFDVWPKVGPDSHVGSNFPFSSPEDLDFQVGLLLPPLYPLSSTAGDPFPVHCHCRQCLRGGMETFSLAVPLQGWVGCL